jgi:hypothetical protein
MKREEDRHRELEKQTYSDSEKEEGIEKERKS